MEDPKHIRKSKSVNKKGKKKKKIDSVPKVKSKSCSGILEAVKKAVAAAPVP